MGPGLGAGPEEPTARGDHRAGARAAEQLEQQHVRHPPVEQVGRPDAVLHGVEGGRHLGDHAAGQPAAVDHGLQLAGGDVADERRGVVDVGQQPGHVREEDGLLGLQRLGERAGHRVGVDVVGLAAAVGPDGRDHGDEVLGQEPLEDARVDRAHVAHVAQVGMAGAGQDQPRALARQAHGQRPVHVDGRHDVAVDLAHQHHAGDVDRLRVGDPQAVAELGLLAQPGHEVADLGAAAVHHHRLQPHGPQQHHVVGDRPAECRVDHGVAAVLDHHHRAAEAVDVGQRLDQHRGPVAGVGHGATSARCGSVLTTCPCSRRCSRRRGRW